MSAPTVLTVILNYRTPEMTRDAAAAAVAAMEGIPGEIAIVDNDSGDGSYEALKAAVAAEGWDVGDRVRVMHAGRNGGYGAGNNHAIRAGLSSGARPDYVYILNSDAFPEKDAIRALVAYLEAHPKAAFAGSYTLGDDGEPQSTAFRFPSIWSEFEGAIRFGPVTRALARHVVPLPVPDETTEVEWLAGASLLARSAALDEIGLFDETFFLYFEETDLFRRAATAGWTSAFVRESVVTHLGSISTGMKRWSRTPTYWFDSRQHYFVKNHGAAYAAAATLAHVAGGVAWRIRLLLERKDRVDPPWFLADLIAHAVRSSLRPVAKRAPRRVGVAPGQA